MKYALLLPILLMSAPVMAQDIPAPLDLGPPEALSVESSNGTHEFMVEIADTREEQIRGLMFRETLGENEGMLFEYDRSAVLSIWMKNTPIPLDILFIRKDGKILKITHSAKPYSERSNSSEGRVRAVLEIPGGRATELGIVPGDVIKHEFFGTKN